MNDEDMEFGTRFDDLVHQGYSDAEVGEILFEDFGEETIEFLVALARVRGRKEVA